MLVVLPAYHLNLLCPGTCVLLPSKAVYLKTLRRNMFIDSKYRNLHFLLKVEAIIGRNDCSNEL